MKPNSESQCAVELLQFFSPYIIIFAIPLSSFFLQSNLIIFSLVRILLVFIYFISSLYIFSFFALPRHIFIHPPCNIYDSINKKKENQKKVEFNFLSILLQFIGSLVSFFRFFFCFLFFAWVRNSEMFLI